MIFGEDVSMHPPFFSSFLFRMCLPLFLKTGPFFFFFLRFFYCFFGKSKSKVEIKNKRASFEYEFLEGFTAGIVLTGTEIKSIRMGKASLVDSYCYFSGNELFVKNMHVAEYWWGSWGKHDPRRDRKLLLTRKELRKLQRAVKEKGLTIVATRLFISEKGYAKLHIELARGKREYDKRQAIKEKDLKRSMEMN